MHHVIVELRGREEARAALMDLVANVLVPGTRAYEGCEHVDMYLDDDASSNLLFVQRWESRAAFEGYLEWRRESGDLSELGQLLTEPVIVRHLRAAADVSAPSTLRPVEP